MDLAGLSLPHFDDSHDSDDPGDALIQPRTQARAAFISDMHFGSASSAAPQLLQFLNHLAEPDKNNRTPGLERLFIVGDAIGMIETGPSIEKMRSHFSQAEGTVAQKILRLGRKGTRIIYIPGNHDALARCWAGPVFPNISIQLEADYRTAAGKKLRVLHGDRCDPRVHNAKLEALATHSYEAIAKLSPVFDRLFRHLGINEKRSLAQMALDRVSGEKFNEAYVNKVVEYLFELNAEIYWRHKRDPQGTSADFYEGIVCGHSHIAARREFASPLDPKTGACMGPAKVTYHNLGHWTIPPRRPGLPPAQTRYPALTGMLDYYDCRFEPVQWTREGIIKLTDFGPGPFHCDRLAPAAPMARTISAAP